MTTHPPPRPWQSLLKTQGERLVFLVALLALVMLLLWWSVFARSLIAQHADLATRHAQTTLRGASLDAELAQIGFTNERRQWMIAGETVVFGLLQLVCVGALFVLARRNAEAKLGLERLLRFTAHELKTPVAGLRALLQSLQLGSIPVAETPRFLAQGVLETNRLEHLVESILAHQRTAAVVAEQRVFRTSDGLVNDVLEHRRQTLGTEQFSHQTTQPTNVSVNVDAFRVVLENLLDNASKYGGGHARIIEVAGEEVFAVRVEDDGVGFEPAEGERLFDPFVRGQDMTNSHGSGLGLYISRQLLRNMGGELRAYSSGRGRGAAFVIELPTSGAST